MRVIYLFPMFLAGLVLKLIDDVYDENILSPTVGMKLSLMAVPLGTWLMLDMEGFVLVGSIFWTTIFRGKIDNPGFIAGYFLTASVWGGLYLWMMPFPLSFEVLASLGVCMVSIVGTTVLHDVLNKRRSVIWELLIEERFLIVILDVPAIPIGVVTASGLLGIFLLVLGYSVGGRMSNWIQSQETRRKIIYSE